MSKGFSTQNPDQETAAAMSWAVGLVTQAAIPHEVLFRWRQGRSRVGLIGMAMVAFWPPLYCSHVRGGPASALDLMAITYLWLALLGLMFAKKIVNFFNFHRHPGDIGHTLLTRRPHVVFESMVSYGVGWMLTRLGMPAAGGFLMVSFIPAALTVVLIRYRFLVQTSVNIGGMQEGEVQQAHFVRGLHRQGYDR